MKPKKIIVAPEHAGQRLDQFLVAQLADRSRAQIQKLIDAGAVTVNEKNVSKHYALKDADAIVVAEKTVAIPPTTQKTEKSKVRFAQPVASPTVLAETEDYLIINKPSGLLVHPTEQKEKNTLVAWLLKHYPEIKKVGDARRPGIVHRLDKDVSGAMVIARTAAMYAHLKHQFHERLVRKVYTALVHGRIASEEGDITFPIARSTRLGAMAARSEKQGGKEAHTYFEVLKHYQNHVLVLAEPKTGRTHQIRVHFFALGNPIVGDPLYKLDKYHKDTLGKNASRIFLHATELHFTDLTGQTMSYVCPVPEVLTKLLEKL